MTVIQHTLMIYMCSSSVAHLQGPSNINFDFSYRPTMASPAGNSFVLSFGSDCNRFDFSPDITLWNLILLTFISKAHAFKLEFKLCVVLCLVFPL